MCVDSCEGRTTCSVNATDETFGGTDPCPDTGKYLEVIYLCVPGKEHQLVRHIHKPDSFSFWEDF